MNSHKYYSKYIYINFLALHYIDGRTSETNSPVSMKAHIQITDLTPDRVNFGSFFFGEHTDG